MRRLWMSLLGVAALGAVVMTATPDPEFLRARTEEILLKRAATWLRAEVPEADVAWSLESPGDDAFLEKLRQSLESTPVPSTSDARPRSPLVATLETSWSDRGGEVHIRLSSSPERSESFRFHPTRLSVLPSLLAILLALTTRRSTVALGSGLLLSSFLLHPRNPLDAVTAAGADLVQAASSSFSLSIVLFVLGLIGAVAIMTASGGVHGLVERASRVLRGRRSASLSTALAGLFVFFDDYSNCVVVGTAMRPVTDRFRISREKLAYIVDSTAAPLASLTLFSTWAWFEIGLMEPPLRELGHVTDSSETLRIFWSMVPFRFYCWSALITLFTCLLANRDFGPMARAETRAFQTGRLAATHTARAPEGLLNLRPKPGVPTRARNAVIPLGSVLLTLGVGFTLFDESLSREAVIALSALIGSGVAGTLAVTQKCLSIRETVTSWFAGARAMILALVLLFLAWALGDSLRDLGTAEYCVACVRDSGGGVWLPLLVFLLSAGVAFSTGSSWSTMALMLPTVIPIAHEVGSSNPIGALGLTLVTMAAVLDGAVFGDHCSPLSDTTILTSAACSCPHLDHVRTQLPYALFSAGVALTLGYLAVSLGGTTWGWFFVPGACVVVFPLVRTFGKRLESQAKPMPSDPSQRSNST